MATDSNASRWEQPAHFGGDMAFRLPLDKGQIEAARETYRENKGAQWSLCFSIGIQVGANTELRDNLICLLYEVKGLPTSTISDMFGISGQEVRKIAQSELVSMFPCLDCGTLLLDRDRRDRLRLGHALYATASSPRSGDLWNTDLLCDHCTEIRLRLHNEQLRDRTLTQQARICQLKKMPFAEYRLTPEWQCRRTQALSRAGYRCQTCGTRDTRLDVHHNTYENYGDEQPQDLMVLCESCHRLFHGRLQDAS